MLYEPAALAAVEVRGAAPGGRELHLLAADSLVRRVNAILLTGGSALGLAAADGVVEFLRARGHGFPTSGGPIPIVPAAVIFDLANGEPIAPTALGGRAACEAAADWSKLARGSVGAGTGATINKLFGPDDVLPGGLGFSSLSTQRGHVDVLVVVNASGTVKSGADPASKESDRRTELLTASPNRFSMGQSTTLVVVSIDAPCDHGLLQRGCIAAHDALARQIRPCHTILDGDTVFAVALQEGELTLSDRVSIPIAVELATEAAVLDAVAHHSTATR
ncbi:MAG: P1 family peptidase [Chloroflexota bacterium]|nr:P1 family peptidase [Chloroflexota bacterium]